MTTTMTPHPEKEREVPEREVPEREVPRAPRVHPARVDPSHLNLPREDPETTMMTMIPPLVKEREDPMATMTMTTTRPMIHVLMDVSVTAITTIMMSTVVVIVATTMMTTTTTQRRLTLPILRTLRLQGQRVPRAVNQHQEG